MNYLTSGPKSSGVCYTASVTAVFSAADGEAKWTFCWSHGSSFFENQTQNVHAGFDFDEETDANAMRRYPFL